ncbi:MAG: MaoC/PaaZ C-terminal domain-containing protein [Alphaproteobacteria bacterium]
MSGLYLEDYTVGRIIETEPVRLDADEIIWFAELHDPQTFHTDPEAAKDSAFCEHVASGFQTVAIATGQFIRTGAVDGTGLGGPGLDKVRWTAPVRPGDTVTARATVIELKPEKSRVTLETVCTVGDTVVISGQAEVLVPRRNTHDA